MKNRLFILFMLIAGAGHAQIQKGAIQTGVDLGYSRLEDQLGANIQKSKSFNIDFSAGYALAQNRVLGLTGQYSEAGESSYITKGIGAFYRSYRPIGKSFLLYGQAALQYIHQESPASGYTRTTNAVQLTLVPGITYLPARWVQFELQVPDFVRIGYQKEAYDIPNSIAAKTLNLGLLGGATSLSNLFSLGVKFNLNNR